MSASRPRALVVVHEPDGGACEIETRLRQRGVAVENHLVTHDLEEPDQARPFPTDDGYDLLVVMGSIRSLTRTHEIGSWIHEELTLVRAFHDAGTPVLGVCFGGQVLADVLGGTVEEAEDAEVGWYEIQAPHGARNPVGPGPWMEWHHDRFTPPPGAEVLAVTPAAPQLFAVGRSVGTQFHPEVNLAQIRRWLAKSSDHYLASLGVTRTGVLADTARHERANVAQCHRLVDWFLDEVAELAP